MACKYANLFGAPNTGPHAYRIADIAVVDVIATFVAAYVVSYTTRWSYGPVLVGLFLLGILLHRIFCVPTTIDKLLFGHH